MATIEKAHLLDNAWMLSTMIQDEHQAEDLVKLQYAAMPEKLILRRSRFELLHRLPGMFGLLAMMAKNKRSIYPSSMIMPNGCSS